MSRVFTEEHKGKISQAQMGNKYAFGNRFKHTEEAKAKIRQANLGNKNSLGHHHTLESKNKIRLGLIGNKNGHGNRSKTGRATPLETRIKLSQAGQGREDTEETRIKKSKARIGMKFAEQHCINVGRSKKMAWSNPEWRDKVVKAQRLGCHIHPNKAEATLLKLLETEYPGEWKFVGDGSMVIGGKNPDFANINGRKELIELFGDYWHKGEDPQNRIDLFKSYGFKMLVIWESELENLDEVLGRIAEFI